MFENKSNLALIMDLQDRLLANIANKDSLLSSNELWIKACKLLQLDTILTEQVPDKLGPTHPALLKVAKDLPVLAKNSFSAFGNEEFLERIERCKPSRLILSGVETSICIYLTAIDAIEHKLQVTVLSDGVAGRRPDDSNTALKELASLGASVIPIETVIYSFLKDASHDQFKPLSALIRERPYSR